MGFVKKPSNRKVRCRAMFSDHPCLTRGDEQADRRRVPILKVGEAERSGGAGKDGKGRSSLAGTSGDDVAVSRGNVVDRTEVALDSRAGAVADVQGSRGGELVELDTAGAGHGEVRGLELGLGGEEEDNAALLAGVAGGDVKVEDSAVAGAQVGVVLGAVGSAGGVLVDGDDGVRGLVRAGKVSLASVAVAISIAVTACSTAGMGRWSRGRRSGLRGGRSRRGRSAGCGRGRLGSGRAR